jgi:nucleotide-binding universal stress UspA family protein
MRKIQKILLPVDLPVSSFLVIRQAGMVARHFGSEIVVLHVITPRSQAAGVPEDSRELAGWDLLAAIRKQAQSQQDLSLGQELAGLTIRPKLVKGDVAQTIVHTAHQEKADLIMMPSHSFTFYQFLRGSAIAEAIDGTECPVWTGAHVEEPSGRPLTIRNVLCAVEFGPRARIAVSWGAQMAAEFGAHLTLANVTAGVESWGPGGSYPDPKWKGELVGNASDQMAKLQQETGVQADVFIGSGEMPKVLSQAAKQTKADLLVTGCYPYGGHLRTHGFGVICAVSIPVLNV